MTVDPRWSFFLSLFISILNFIAGSTPQFTDLGFEATTVKFVLALVALITGVLSLINTALAAIPSKDAHTGFFLAPKEQPKP
jgi:hypothetical protein